MLLPLHCLNLPLLLLCSRFSHPAMEPSFFAFQTNWEVARQRYLFVFVDPDPRVYSTWLVIDRLSIANSSAEKYKPSGIESQGSKAPLQLFDPEILRRLGVKLASAACEIHEAKWEPLSSPAVEIASHFASMRNPGERERFRHFFRMLEDHVVLDSTFAPIIQALRFPSALTTSPIRFSL